MDVFLSGKWWNPSYLSPDFLLHLEAVSYPGVPASRVKHQLARWGCYSLLKLWQACLSADSQRLTVSIFSQLSLTTCLALGLLSNALARHFLLFYYLSSFISPMVWYINSMMLNQFLMCSPMMPNQRKVDHCLCLSILSISLRFIIWSLSQ